MVDEAKPRVEERPATHKKKLQLYLFVSLGLLIIGLILATILNVISKIGENSKPIPKKEDAVSTSNQPKQDDFSKLLDSRRIEPPKEVTPEVVPAGNPYTRKAQEMANREQQNNSKERDYVAEGMKKWEVQERLRALDSYRKSWGGVKGDSNQKYAATQGTSNTSSVADTQGMTIERQRELTRQRIEEAERRRQELLQKGAASAAANPGTNSITVAGMPAGNQSLMDVMKFNASPKNVVGYTKENKYGADVEGMMKIPTGTIIPAITMMTWNSDFPGTPSKAMLDHDVYDAKRENILLPAGTEFMTKSVSANGINDPIQNRMAYLVGEAILPDGNTIDLTKAAGLDREGMGGVKDQVEYHFLAQALGVAAYAMVSGGTSRSGSGANNDETYAGEVGSEMRQQFAPLAQKYLNIVPTKKVRAGQSIRIILQDDVYVKPWKGVYDDYIN